MSESHIPGFNRIVERFADDLSRPEYRAQWRRKNALAVEMRRRNLFLRENLARDWEHCHVALGVKAAAPRSARIVDFGGGGSILCYELALSGYDVTVIDVDRDVCDFVNSNAAVLGFASRLKAVHYDGRSAWPHEDATIDIVASVSVFEGLLPRQRRAFFRETARVLAPQGQLLLTFDFGEGARLIADPPTSVAEIVSEIVVPSGLSLIPPLPVAPLFTKHAPPPVRLAVKDVDGFDYVMAEYTFGAIQLMKTRASPPAAAAAPGGAQRAGGEDDDIETLSLSLLGGLARDGRLRDLAPIAVRFELWEEEVARAWSWREDAAGSDAAAPRPADCIFAGTEPALRQLLLQPDSFWTLYYGGEPPAERQHEQGVAPGRPPAIQRVMDGARPHPGGARSSCHKCPRHAGRESCHFCLRRRIWRRGLRHPCGIAWVPRRFRWNTASRGFTAPGWHSMQRITFARRCLATPPSSASGSPSTTQPAITSRRSISPSSLLRWRRRCRTCGTVREPIPRGDCCSSATRRPARMRTMICSTSW